MSGLPDSRGAARSLDECRAAAASLRNNRVSIRAALSEPGGLARIDSLITEMRESSMKLASISREFTKTADVLVSERRRFRAGIRA